MADVTYWSDEVELLAKLIAYISTPAGKYITDWKRFLPERFLTGALVADIPSEARQHQIRRGLSAQLDMLAKEIRANQRIRS